uniref:protein spinster homolog 2-like n=1 Tax=Halichoerus grypus TaxID=9711 RepID=UPI00165961A9|nr:protein spinster homolog 2-like [Halichoerus grypus]
MVAAPIFGYLGDRFNRKVILSCGIFFWSAVTFSSSFIPQQHFWLLVLSRGLVGIGEASYSTIAPTIIGDLFTKNTRTLMLSVFYFAIPLGSGLGYITGSSVKQAAGDWHWALRVRTPPTSPYPGSPRDSEPQPPGLYLGGLHPPRSVYWGHWGARPGRPAASGAWSDRTRDALPLSGRSRSAVVRPVPARACARGRPRRGLCVGTPGVWSPFLS